nr:MAG TPA: hypothetical protein [Caudoviricetes sp.]
MVTTHTAIQVAERRGAKKTEKGKDKRNKQRKERTQWCSGITCVLAKLRAHYPEHQKREEEKKDEETRQETRHPPTTAIPQ